MKIVLSIAMTIALIMFSIYYYDTYSNNMKEKIEDSISLTYDETEYLCTESETVNNKIYYQLVARNGHTLKISTNYDYIVNRIYVIDKITVKNIISDQTKTIYNTNFISDTEFDAKAHQIADAMLNDILTNTKLTYVLSVITVILTFVISIIVISFRNNTNVWQKISIT